MALLPEVHLLAGLNGAGKTTFAKHFERTLPAVRFTLDEWMLRLNALAFDHPDYPPAAARCRDLMWDTAVQVLRTGSPVVLDWNQWSRSGRAEWVSASERGRRAVRAAPRPRPDRRRRRSSRGPGRPRGPCSDGV